MLVVYKFEKSGQQIVAPIQYCFHIVLPVRTGLAAHRHMRIGDNTASFSPPTLSNPSSNSARGYFFADPKDRIITLEVTDVNPVMSMEETAELYVPARTFLAYIAAHPPSAVPLTELATPRLVAGASGPVINVPWEEWGPHGAHLVRPKDQAYIIRRPRACGMRVIGSPLSEKSVVVVDYHPGRVARSATAARAPFPTAAPAQPPVEGGTSSSRSRPATGTSTLTRMPRCFPRLVCATKEVPLPPELQKAAESPWTMLCEDALLAFEVSNWIFVIIGVSSCSYDFQCTVCPGRVQYKQGVCIYVLIVDWPRGATCRASTSIYYHYLSVIYRSSIFFPRLEVFQIHIRNDESVSRDVESFGCLRWWALLYILQDFLGEGYYCITAS